MIITSFLRQTIAKSHQILYPATGRVTQTIRVPVTCLSRDASEGVKMSTLETLQFDNRILRSLPIDQEKDNHVRSVSGACYSLVKPTPVNNPVLVSASLSAIKLLGLSPEEIHRTEFTEYFSGNKLLPGSVSAAHCYCGHQFGHFSGQLGDGCAIYLGELINSEGERWELQLKGSGKTPYSRHADGRKVLRSSIREFLCSEAMHHLGIPTTRAGTCITSDTRVARDIFYDGNTIFERATIISRIAPTFIRFGSFEIFKTRDSTTGRTGPSVGRADILNQLVDYTIQSFYPHIDSLYSDNREERVAAFFQELCVRTAHLVAQWQCVGFCHGVLNTDNMSIVGLTIDYGPYGFMDRYDPGHICNGSDESGRYAYDQQPSICKWNLQKLAEALSLCLPEEGAKKGLEMYDSEFQDFYLSQMRKKLGLIKKKLPEDSDIVESFLQTLHETGCDFTNGFRYLNKIDLQQLQNPGHIESVQECLIQECATPTALAKSFKPKMSMHQLVMFQALQRESPMLLLQLGITSEFMDNEMKKITEIEKTKKMNTEEKIEADRGLWMKWFRMYVQRLLQEIEGNDVSQIMEIQKERLEIMNKSNPRFLLRNYLLQDAIELAEKGDYTEVDRLLKLSHNPYSEEQSTKDYVEETSQRNDGPTGAVSNETCLGKYFCRPPEATLDLCVT